MSDKNLAIWNDLCKTDPEFTKNFNRGGFKGTAINAAYVIRELTRQFGPCGVGWKLVIDDERIHAGHVLSDGRTQAQLHAVRGHLEYFYPADRSWRETGPQFGQTMLVNENRNGLFTDEEAPKKSVTDCLTKCAMMIGLGADIHLGEFDDKYTAPWTEREATTKPAAPPVAPPVAEPVNDDLAAVTNCEELLDYLQMMAETADYQDAAKWKPICKAVAEKFPKIDTPDDPKRDALLTYLQAESKRLDEMKGGTTKPKRTRAKKAA